MKKPTVILFTLTDQSNSHTFGLFSIKAYALEYLKYRPQPSIIIKIFKTKDSEYNQDSLFFKLTEKEIDHIVHWLLQKKPLIIGFSCWLNNSKVMLTIADKIKKRNKKIKLVIGGPETYHNYFYDMKKIMKKEKAIDVIARYDGEEVFLELLESFLYQKRTLAEIKGITYRDGKKICLTPERGPTDLNKIPSPYSKGLIMINKTIKKAVMELSRGCPYRCNYCSYPLGIYRYYRCFPMKQIQNDLKYLLKKDIKSITMVDSNFNVYENRITEILKIIQQNNKKNMGVGVFYNASKKIINKEIIDLFFSSKIKLTIGVQAINPHTLQLANRQGDMSILEKNLYLLDKKDVTYALEFIYGLPGDSYIDIKNVINWLFQFNARSVHFYRLSVQRNTPFFFQAKQLGLIYKKTPPYHVIQTKTFSKEDINKIGKMLKLVRYYYDLQLLRKMIYQINVVFHLNYADIFEKIIIWDRSFGSKPLSPIYAYKRTQQFFAYLLRSTYVNHAGISPMSARRG